MKDEQAKTGGAADDSDAEAITMILKWAQESLVRGLVDQLVDLGFGPDINPARRFIEQFKPLVDFIVSEGGPGLPAWCDISAPKSPCIVGQGWAPNEGGECCEVDDADVVNHEAVLDCLCMWVHRVRAWWVDLVTKDRRCASLPYLGGGRWSAYITGAFDPTHKVTFHSSPEEASLALLKAICEALGMEAHNEPTE